MANTLLRIAGAAVMLAAAGGGRLVEGFAETHDQELHQHGRRGFPIRAIVERHRYEVRADLKGRKSSTKITLKIK